MFTALGLFFGKFKMQIIAVIAVLAVLGLAYGYWNYSQNKIQTLTAANAVLKSANETQDKTIAALRENFKQMQQKLTDLNKSYSQIRQDAINAKKTIIAGTVTKTNKAQVKKTITDSMNSIFQDLNNESNPDSFEDQ